MVWRRKDSESLMYSKHLEDSGKKGMEETIPKGCIPMLVGCEEGKVERILVPIRLLKDPSVAALLEMAAIEFGYRQQGILRVPWDAQQFRQMVDAVSKIR
ncbi:auxin-responsive protein SAUR71-like [Cocos nucifera]|nr:auxin-responsive protein SAUR71-like [Cocos nucifera]